MSFLNLLKDLTSREPSPADVASVVRVTPVGALVSGLNAIVFTLFHWSSLGGTALVCWALSTICLCYFVYRRAARVRHVTVTRVSRRAARMLLVTSVMLAVPWATLAFAVVPFGGPYDQVIALILGSGMMTCAAVMLQRTMFAALAYVATVGLGVFGGCIIAGLSNTFNIIVYTLLCAAFIIYSAHVSGRTARERDQSLTDLTSTNEKLAAANVRITTLAFKDPVTGLSNRKAFYDLLEESVAPDSGGNGRFSVLLLDLDNFKNINDTYGHNFGDELLNEIGLRISAIAAEDSAVARLGGDEFAVLVRSPESGAVAFGERVIQAVSAPVELEGRQIMPTTSIGVSEFPAHGRTPTELLVKADIALAHAKDQGKARVAPFDASLGKRLNEENEIADELRGALDHGGLRIHYQPKVCLRTGRLNGAEALLRWDHPTWGGISPEIFLPIAADRGLIQPICDFVFRQVAEDAAEWKAAGLDFGRLAVNIHPTSLKSPDQLLRSINDQTARGAGPETIALEITEGCFVGRGTEGAPMILDDLADRGYWLSLDDFGTGHAALTHLRSLPVREIKIDKSFVSNIENAPSDRAIVAATIAIAQGMGLQSVAEGVETESQIAILQELGADVGQGYYWSRPIPAGEYLEMAQSLQGSAGGQKLG